MTGIVAQTRATAFYVYMLASRRNGTFYVGMTDDLARRIHEHKTGALPGFTRQHRVTKLVRYEVHDSREAAFARERLIKRWRREWKIALVLETNGKWRDLCETLQLCRPGPMDPRFRGGERRSWRVPR